MLDDEIRARKRRRLSRFLFPFVAALPLPFLVYALIAFSSGGFSWIFAIITIVYICAFTVGVFIVYGRDRIIDRTLRASPVPPSYQQKLWDCCEEISLASGFQPPRLRYIDRDGINALAFGWKGKGTMFLTRGLLDSLSHDEMLAVVAHEMARINLGYSYATVIRSTLGAIPIMLNVTLGSLLGLVLSGLGILLILLLLFALLPLYLLDSGGGDGIVTVIYMLVMIPLVFLVCRALESGGPGYQNTFFLADDLAIKWTMDPEALISAMRKMQPLYTEKAYSFLQRLAFVPYIPDRRRPPRNPDTPFVVSGARETNMPMPDFNRSSRRPMFPSVAVREEELEKSMGHPL